jgi:site-specific recombinase XerD
MRIEENAMEEIPADPVALYLEELITFRSPSRMTIRNKRNTLSRFFEWLDIKGYEWNHINEGILVNWVGNLNVKGQSKKKLIQRLRSFYDWAINKGWAKGNPATKLYSPPKSPPRAARKSLNKEEVAKLLDALPLLGDVQRFIVTFALSRPVRISEMLHLRVKDVDFENNRVFIGFNPNKSVKTEGSCRYLTIPTRSRPIMERLIQGKNEDDYVVGVKASTANTLVAKIFGLAGVPTEGRNSHAFRHTVIERLIFEDKIDPAIVAKMAGNSPNTIYTSYLTGVSQDNFDQAMMQAESF